MTEIVVLGIVGVVCFVVGWLVGRKWNAVVENGLRRDLSKLRGVIK